MTIKIKASAALVEGLGQISSPKSVPKDVPDTHTKQEIETLELEKAKLENRGIEQDLTQRKEYADKIFILIMVWLVCIFGLLIAQGLGFIYISENVLITIIGGTTVNVLGIFVIVANYIFYRPNSRKKRNK